MPIDFPAFVYATAVAAGGVLGYIKSSSIPSLSAGLFFGGALTYAAYEVSSTPPKYGLFFGTSATLGGIMGYRFYKTRKIMPAGIIALLSTAMIIRGVWMRYKVPALKVE